MYIAKVLGPVIANIRYSKLNGAKLLAVMLIDEEGRYLGEEQIVFDRFGAKSGDIVMIVDDGETCWAVLNRKFIPLSKSVAGFIDSYSYIDESNNSKEFVI